MCFYVAYQLYEKLTSTSFFLRAPFSLSDAIEVWNALYGPMNLCLPSLFFIERSDCRDESDLNPVSPVVLFCSDLSRSTHRLLEVA